LVDFYVHKAMKAQKKLAYLFPANYKATDEK